MIHNSEDLRQLTTTAVNLSTRAIVVTLAQGVSSYRLIQFSFRFLR